MKPFPVALLTREDVRIWLTVAVRLRDDDYETDARVSAMKADRRDAELMLSLRNARANLIKFGFDHGLLASDCIRELLPDGSYYGGVPLPRIPL